MACRRRFRSPGLQALYDRFVGDDPERIASYERALKEDRMEIEERKALEAAGFRFGDAAEFLGLTEEERTSVDDAVARARVERAALRNEELDELIDRPEGPEEWGTEPGWSADLDRLRDGVQVHDAFESKASYNLDDPPGMVAVLEGFASRSPGRFIGQAVRIVTGSGTPIRATIDDARDHGTTISFFFKGLSKRDVPIGSIVSLEDRPGR